MGYSRSTKHAPTSPCLLKAWHRYSSCSTVCRCPAAVRFATVRLTNISISFTAERWKYPKLERSVAAPSSQGSASPFCFSTARHVIFILACAHRPGAPPRARHGRGVRWPWTPPWLARNQIWTALQQVRVKVCPRPRQAGGARAAREKRRAVSLPTGAAPYRTPRQAEALLLTSRRQHCAAVIREPGGDRRPRGPAGRLAEGGARPPSSSQRHSRGAPREGAARELPSRAAW
eukprot:scaffold871_cov340-Prasinococcus_capsulatus_cf.AAC.5